MTLSRQENADAKQKKTRLHMFNRSLHMLLLNGEFKKREKSLIAVNYKGKKLVSCLRTQHQDLGLSRPGVQSVLQLPPDNGWCSILFIVTSYIRAYSTQLRTNLRQIISDSRLQIHDFNSQTKEALGLFTDIKIPYSLTMR